MRALSPIVLIALGFAVLAAPVAAMEYSELKTLPAAPGGTLTVDASFHDVTVTAEPGSEVRIQVDLAVAGSGTKAEKRMAGLKPTFEVEGDAITVRSVERSSGWNWGWSRTEGRIQVWLPPDMDVVVDISSGRAEFQGDFGGAELTVDSSSGRAVLDGAAGAFRVDNSSGGTEARVDRPLEVFEVDCSSGRVELMGGASRADVDTSSGSIRLEGLRGDAEVSASSGRIQLGWDAVTPGMSVDANASSGSVTVIFPPGTELDGDVDTSSGGIRSDFAGRLNEDRDHLRLEGGPDAVRIRVDTSSGSVTLIES